jgi:glutamine amidotransferase-like uncharacterized protein
MTDIIIVSGSLVWFVVVLIGVWRMRQYDKTIAVLNAQHNELIHEMIRNMSDRIEAIEKKLNEVESRKSR